MSTSDGVIGSYCGPKSTQLLNPISQTCAIGRHSCVPRISRSCNLNTQNATCSSYDFNYFRQERCSAFSFVESGKRERSTSRANSVETGTDCYYPKARTDHTHLGIDSVKGHGLIRANSIETDTNCYNPKAGGDPTHLVIDSVKGHDLIRANSIETDTNCYNPKARTDHTHVGIDSVKGHGLIRASTIETDCHKYNRRLDRHRVDAVDTSQGCVIASADTFETVAHVHNHHSGLHNTDTKDSISQHCVDSLNPSETRVDCTLSYLSRYEEVGLRDAETKEYSFHHHPNPITKCRFSSSGNVYSGTNGSIIRGNTINKDVYHHSQDLDQIPSGQRDARTNATEGDDYAFKHTKPSDLTSFRPIDHDPEKSLGGGSIKALRLDHARHRIPHTSDTENLLRCCKEEIADGEGRQDRRSSPTATVSRGSRRGLTGNSCLRRSNAVVEDEDDDLPSMQGHDLSSSSFTPVPTRGLVRRSSTLATASDNRDHTYPPSSDSRNQRVRRASTIDLPGTPGRYRADDCLSPEDIVVNSTKDFLPRYGSPPPRNNSTFSSRGIDSSSFQNSNTSSFTSHSYSDQHSQRQDNTREIDTIKRYSSPGQHFDLKLNGDVGSAHETFEDANHGSPEPLLTEDSGFENFEPYSYDPDFEARNTFPRDTSNQSTDREFDSIDDNARRSSTVPGSGSRVTPVAHQLSDQGTIFNRDTNRQDSSYRHKGLDSTSEIAVDRHSRSCDWESASSFSGKDNARHPYRQASASQACPTRSANHRFDRDFRLSRTTAGTDINSHRPHNSPTAVSHIRNSDQESVESLNSARNQNWYLLSNQENAGHRNTVTHGSSRERAVLYPSGTTVSRERVISQTSPLHPNKNNNKNSKCINTTSDQNSQIYVEAGPLSNPKHCSTTSRESVDQHYSALRYKDYHDPYTETGRQGGQGKTFARADSYHSSCPAGSGNLQSSSVTNKQRGISAVDAPSDPRCSERMLDRSCLGRASADGSAGTSSWSCSQSCYPPHTGQSSVTVEESLNDRHRSHWTMKPEGRSVRSLKTEALVHSNSTGTSSAGGQDVESPDDLHGRYSNGPVSVQEADDHSMFNNSSRSGLKTATPSTPPSANHNGSTGGEVSSDGRNPKGEQLQTNGPQGGLAKGTPTRTEIDSRNKNLTFTQVKEKVALVVSELKAMEEYHHGEGMKYQKLIGDMYWDCTNERTQIGDYLAELGYAEVTINMLKQMNSLGIFKNDEIWFPTYYTYNTAWNYSDASEKLARSLAEAGAVKLMTLNLGHKPYLDNMHSKNVFYVLKASLSTLHNIARCTGVKHYFKEIKTAEVVMPLISANDEFLKSISMLTLAYIVEEEENAKLIDETNTIKNIASWIHKALESKQKRRFRGFAPWELTQGLAKLAVNDSNKTKILEEGVLGDLTAMLKHSDQKEQATAAECIWTLSFDKNVRQAILEFPDLVPALEELASSTTPPPSASPSSSSVDTAGAGSSPSLASIVRKNVQGALWLIKGDNDPSNNVGRPASGQCTKNHIFISYSWNEKELVKMIHSSLVAEGYQTWIDWERMEGSTLEAMAQAVENSAVVLVCMSERYKQSPNCRTEAEYMFQLRKDYIPLMCQKRYRPDGWLGAILGAKLFFDFSGKYPYEKPLQGLLKELRGRGKSAHPAGLQNKGSVDEVDSSPSANHHPVTSSSGSVSHSSPLTPNDRNTVAECVSMDHHHVETWLVSQGLQRLTSAFSQVDGQLIWQLKKMRESAPEYFHSSLERQFGMTLIDILRFNAALDSLH